MYANDNIQNVTFGHKIVSYCNNIHTSIEAVKLDTNQHQIVCYFAREQQENNETITITIECNNSSNGNISKSERKILGQECRMNSLDSKS